jgi:hypothetical protein
MIVLKHIEEEKGINLYVSRLSRALITKNM